MSTHPDVTIIDRDEEANLVNYHYSKDAEHSGETDRWKGIVMDEKNNRVHAMSFPWAETLIGDHVPSDMIYFKHRESSILRFYVGPDGKPRVSTHRRIDISNTNTRVHTGKPFIQLIEQAIANWPYVASMESHLANPAMAFDPAVSAEELAYAPQVSIFKHTPEKWQDLCIPGFCHVFLLVDVSNQITDDSNLKEVTEIISVRDIEEEPDMYFIGPDGEVTSETISEGDKTREVTVMDTIEETRPELIYAISYKANDTPSSDGIYWMTPYRGPIRINHETPLERVAIDSIGYEMHDPETGDLLYDIGHGANITILETPALEPLSPLEASDILRSGSAVVGFPHINSDQSIKFYSDDYAYKIELVGETFNPIHRWHQLMDINPDIALQYLDVIPWHLKPITQDMMIAKHQEYMDHTVKFLSNLVIDYADRRPGENDIYARVWNKPGIRNIMDTMRIKVAKGGIRRPKDIAPTLEKMIRDDMTYTEFHNLHGTIMKASKVEDYHTYIVSFLADLVLKEKKRRIYGSIWNDSMIHDILEDALRMSRNPKKRDARIIGAHIGANLKGRLRTHDQYHTLYTSIMLEEHLEEIASLLAELVGRKIRLQDDISKIDQELWNRSSLNRILEHAMSSLQHPFKIEQVAQTIRSSVIKHFKDADVHSLYESLRHY